jgi:hypothetical protein
MRPVPAAAADAIIRHAAEDRLTRKLPLARDVLDARSEEILQGLGAKLDLEERYGEGPGSTASRPVVTWTLAAASTLYFLVEVLAGGSEGVGQLRASRRVRAAQRGRRHQGGDRQPDRRSTSYMRRAGRVSIWLSFWPVTRMATEGDLHLAPAVSSRPPARPTPTWRRASRVFGGLRDRHGRATQQQPSSARAVKHP